jgi:hypothetical protein
VAEFFFFFYIYSILISFYLRAFYLFFLLFFRSCSYKRVISYAKSPWTDTGGLKE